jgi:hypothetical protein
MPGKAVTCGWLSSAGSLRLGLADALDMAVPEPPEHAVLAALEHVTTASPWYRLFTQAREALTETQQDDFYAAAGEAATALLPAAAEQFDDAAASTARGFRVKIRYCSSKFRVPICSCQTFQRRGMQQRTSLGNKRCPET